MKHRRALYADAADNLFILSGGRFVPFGGSYERSGVMRPVHADIGLNLLSRKSGRFRELDDEEVSRSIGRVYVNSSGDLCVRHRAQWVGVSAAPEWVPDGALVHIDFLSVRAWTADSGEVAIANLLGADNPATQDTWGATTGYEPAELLDVGVGYRMENTFSSDGFAFVGEAKALLLAGATTVHEFMSPSGIPALEFRALAHYILKADGSFGVYSRFIAAPNSSNTLTVEGWGVGEDNQSDQGAVLDAAINRVALTIQENEAAASANGRAFIVSNTTSEGWPFETVAMGIDSAPPFTLRTITIYEVQDNADLPALSEL